MNFLLIFLLLQAILRVKFVLNREIKLVEEGEDNEFSEEDDHQRIKSGNKQVKPAVASGKFNFHDAPSQYPIEISPTSVIEMSTEDASEITTEWIESRLIPTFKADK